MATDPQTGQDATATTGRESSLAGTASDDSTQVVTQNRERSRFEIAVDGVRAGLAEYTERGGRRIFFHTEVDDAYSGQGLAGVLVRRALDATRAGGLRVVPVCPYVAKYVKSHHDWDDIIDPVDQQAIEAVREATR
ncbi:GNAT family N-acetyltransferase [Intrasporangium sp. DVR]|uniref:GNAT family N-acetyltransferase n=1 Tax=Intrasporangium sp. DVR TaxID=3127867 RepID=UPI00313A5DDA